jgi:hypothetical protein
MRYYAEMTEQEIASTLKISHNSVRTHLRREWLPSRRAWRHAHDH